MFQKKFMLNIFRLLLTTTILAPTCLRAQETTFEMRPSSSQSVFLSSKNGFVWKMQKVEKADSGKLVSTLDYKTDGWLSSTIPGTVLNSLVQDKVYADPYYGDNNKYTLKLIPDINDVGREFYHYWFRTEFNVSKRLNGKKTWLKLHGINYRATVWLNGINLGRLSGMFDAGNFDVTNVIKHRGNNVLAIDVSPVDIPGNVYLKNKSRNGAIGENKNGGDGEIGRNVTMLMSVGWDFTAPDGIRDRNTGIWRDVELYSTGNVTLGHPLVQTRLPLPDTSYAFETVSVEVKNNTGSKQKGKFEGKIKGTDIHLEKEVELQPNEERIVVFRPSEYPQLIMSKPKLWWPVNKGNPHLYKMDLAFKQGSETSHKLTTSFGVRQITSDQNTPDRSRRFIVNGHPVFIRGTNWIPEAMLRTSPARTKTELRYTRQAGFNMVRLWAGGIAESDLFYDVCDALGLLVWNEFWITGDTRFPEDTSLYFQNLRSTVKRIRSHPSVAYYVATNESKALPGTEEAIHNADSANGYQQQSECCGVHDGSPYKYENPMQYFENTASTRGSRINGFNPEYGTPCLPLVESLREMMPQKDLWPINDTVWNYLDGNGFHNMNSKYREAVDQFGKSTTIDEYAKKAQLVGAMNYRAICEVWNRNKFNWGDRFASGFLFWYNNSPLPQTASRMYDWYLRPTAALYFAQNGLAALHPQFDYHTNTVSVYNDFRKDFAGYTVQADIYDFASRLVHTETKKINIPADGLVADALKLEFNDSITQVHFIKIILKDSYGRDVADALYWRSKDHYNEAWTMTGPAVSGFSNMDKLPQVTLSTTVEKRVSKNSCFWDVHVKNISRKLAFFTQVKLADKANAMLPATFYTDNYFSLLPGETRKITIEMPEYRMNETYHLSVSAFNARETSLKL
ncbi:MAG: glycoside hydrolase family 2 [Pseudopedobacter saltans]|uniref:Glycoside hydrolase family 2 n=1 Tax=Pseudopedobacter saltans TaxID=151895 RepID=A0A2W5EL10_9SPHI|nr:MAG: glycoside hydrolase family 2 [Pseudopedobacter saltans]